VGTGTQTEEQFVDVGGETRVGLSSHWVLIQQLLHHSRFLEESRALFDAQSAHAETQLDDAKTELRLLKQRALVVAGLGDLSADDFIIETTPNGTVDRLVRKD
jgi:hypothetical protein